MALTAWGRKIVALGKGLYEVVELPAAGFPEPMLGGHYPQVRLIKDEIQENVEICQSS